MATEPLHDLDWHQDDVDEFDELSDLLWEVQDYADRDDIMVL